MYMDLSVKYFFALSRSLQKPKQTYNILLEHWKADFKMIKKKIYMKFVIFPV